MQLVVLHTGFAQLASHVVISEVYGGGGNAGSLYRNDYIELYNPTNSPIAMTNWSVQYASATGVFAPSKTTILTGVIGARGYLLIQEASGGGGTNDLPLPDVVDSIAMSASSGKVALVSDTLPITGISDPTVVDFLGYGSADTAEGGNATPGLSATKSAERKALATSIASSMKFGGQDSLKGNGWDSGNNDSDFVVRTSQDPQNSRSLLEDTSNGNFVTTSYGVSAGWNMISVPLEVSDYAAGSLYPSASSSAFAYDGAYSVKETLANAAGYWLRFPADSAIELNGHTRATGIIPVVDGWNLIGSLSSGVPVANVTSNPPGIIVSSFFGFTTSYTVTDVLIPSKAYWVKVNGAGTLSLVAGAAAKFAQIVDDRLRTVTFVDHEMHRATLSVGSERDFGARALASELPPPPPAGSFDVRFASQRNVVTYDGRSRVLQRFPIELRASAYPVTIHWVNDQGDGATIFLSIGSQRIAESRPGNMSITIDHPPAERVSLDVIVEGQVPPEYFLSPCFPNPFNPSTRFTVSMPHDEPLRVTIYDVLGRQVKRIVDGPVSAGSRTFEWDGSTDDGRLSPGGMYFLRMSGSSFVKTEKLVLLK